MSAKLQALWAYIKTEVSELLDYVVIPLAFVCGVFYYLFTKNEIRVDDKNVTKDETKLEVLHEQQANIDGTAAADLAAYAKLRSSYLSGRASSGGQGDSGSTGAGEDKGPGTGSGADTSPSSG
jgi:uncharacterized protein YhbP (UPF0306 family)